MRALTSFAPSKAMKLQLLLSFLLGPVVTSGLLSPARADCTISVTSLSFGSYDVFRTMDDLADGRVDYQCTNLPSGAIPVLTLSTGSSNDFQTRTMKNSSESLKYNIYTDASRTEIWGDGGGQTAVITLENLSGSKTFFGTIPQRQNVKVGSYEDMLTVTLSY